MSVRALVMALLFVLFWSSAFTSARIIVADAPPILILAVRFAMMGVIALGIGRLLGETLRLNRAQLRATMLFGLCQNALYLGLNFYAMQTVEASLASIIASTMPLMVALLGWLGFGQSLSKAATLGLVVGFAGVTLIMGFRLEIGVDAVGVVLCVLAALALSIATLSVRGASSGGNVWTVVGLQALVGSSVLLIVGLYFETWYLNYSLRWGLAFGYTLVFPGLIATWIWMKLINDIGAVRASSFHFLNPFFGAAVAATLLAEPVAWSDWVGVAIVMLGIALVQRASSNR